MSRKLLAAALWGVPCLVCLILYWPGLLAWFQQDDFVWLNLPNQAHGFQATIHTIFAPTTQGTWRPLSERIFFLLFGYWFGSDALPYRIWVFLTMFANLTLLQSVAARMTHSRAAGFWAAILWIVNSKLVTVMSWTCEYILVACGFFLLLALHFFLRYIETGRGRDYAFTWAAFLTGFLAMETNIVFPALVATYAFACARPFFRRTLPFFAASAAYGLFHLKFAPNQGTLPYTMHFDGALVSTIVSYWRRSFEPIGLEHISWITPPAGLAIMLACSAALLAFVILRAWRKDWLPSVLALWFLILLGPVVPLRDHLTDYYLTLPVMSLAMLGASALLWSWRHGAAFRTAGVLLAGAFILLHAPVARRQAQWFRDRGAAQEALVLGVDRAHELHPGKVILLDGIDDSLFWGAIEQRPFLFLRIPDVYLTPGSESIISPHPELDEISKFIMPVDEVRRALARGSLVVYRAGDGPLQNITDRYFPPAASASGPLRIDLGDPLIDDRLGPGWYRLENGIRWMGRSASLRMTGPRSAGQRLYASAICPQAQLASGPLQMTLSVDGIGLPPVRFTQGDVESTFDFSLPPQLTGKDEVQITVSVSRTVRIRSDNRDLGLAFGRFEIR